MSQPVQRRLTAILAADVVGYSRMMEADETGTLTRLKLLRSQVIDPRVAALGGSIVKLMGDGALVAFPSVVDAVQCATEIQQALETCDSLSSGGPPIRLRIGINVGDVILDGDDIYGDGVNVAARLQALATPGGIAISASVREQIGTKLPVLFEDLGEHSVKNIERPIHVFMARFGASAAEARKEASLIREARSNAKPSVAVLPFANMSGDPEQEYFSDGITEDIITDLSNVSMLTVASRNTTFVMKHKATDVLQVARHLNVTHVVEGSVRKSGNRLRVTAQLTDGENGRHIWAERYDRDLDDVFALQDELSHAIVDALKIRLFPAERESIGQRTTDNVEAYQLYLMGRYYYLRRNRQSTRIALDFYRRATESDPTYARAWASLALGHSRMKRTGSSGMSLAEIESLVSKALQLDDRLAEAHAARGRLLYHRMENEAAEAACRRAIDIDHNLSDARDALADILRRSGRLLEAARSYEAAVKLDQNDYGSPCMAWDCYMRLSSPDDAHRLATEAMLRLERAIASDPEDSRAYALGAFILPHLGMKERAFEWAERAISLDSHDALSQYNVACFFVRMGEMERAFGILDRCMPLLGKFQLTWMKRDPDFDSVRDHPRYKALIAREEGRWDSESATP